MALGECNVVGIQTYQSNLELVGKGKVLPLAALQSMSFAAIPGGLCQLLSNPLT